MSMDAQPIVAPPSLPRSGPRSDLVHPRLWQSVCWLALVLLAVLSVLPDPPQVNLPLLGWDKAQHAIAYAGLMWLFRQAFRPSAIPPVGLAALGIALEGAQAWTATRTPDALDVLANLTGIGLGLLIAATPLGRTLSWADRRIPRFGRGAGPQGPSGR